MKCEQARVPAAKLFNVGAFDLPKVLEEQYMDEEEFNQFYESKMDRSISNVGVRCKGALSMFAFQRFLNKYLGEEEDAKDFLRVKGVLNIQGSDEQYVLQCVHMLRNQAFTKPWGKGNARENRIIFIGRNMQQRRQELTEGFEACIAKPLRFKVGDEVRAKTGEGPHEDGYENGYIVDHWDELKAYRIRLLNGDEVQAPMDDDRFVMAA